MADKQTILKVLQDIPGTEEEFDPSELSIYDLEEPKSSGSGEEDPEDDKEDTEDGSSGSSNKDSDDSDSDDKENGEETDSDDKEDSDSDGDSDSDDSSDSEPGEQIPSKNDKTVTQRDLEKIKDKLAVDIAKKSGLGHILTADKDKDKHELGSHEDGKLTNGEEPDNNDDDNEVGKDSELSKEDLDLHIDDEINNLIDIEDEINQAVDDEKERKRIKDNLAPANHIGLSDIHMTDKTRVVFVNVMNYVSKWIKKIKGEQMDDDPEWRSDTPSRKIPDLWGREMDTDPPEETTNKVLLFIFDTSGSMPTKLMAEVCSDIAMKMTKDKTVDRVAMLNIAGIWSSPKKFEPVRGIKQRMRRFLKIQTGSDLKPAWHAIEHLINTQKSKIGLISGLIIVSDFQVASFRVPDSVRKLKPSILALNISESDSDYAMEFIKQNTGVAVHGISIIGKKVKVLNTLKVGNK